VLAGHEPNPAPVRFDIGLGDWLESEITVRPHDDGTVEIGGRTEIVETREFAV
jgi:hypothetical protein